MSVTFGNILDRRYPGMVWSYMQNTSEGGFGMKVKEVPEHLFVKLAREAIWASSKSEVPMADIALYIYGKLKKAKKEEYFSAMVGRLTGLFILVQKYEKELGGFVKKGDGSMEVSEAMLRVAAKAPFDDEFKWKTFMKGLKEEVYEEAK